MAASADRECINRKGEVEEVPVYRSSKIFGGTFVCENATGYHVKGSNTAGLKLAGVSKNQADNSAVAVDGAINVTIARTGYHRFKSSGLTQADIEKACFLTDDDTVQLSGGHVFGGVIKRIISADECDVDIEPAVRCYRGALGRFFELHFHHKGVVGASKVTIRDGIECPGPLKILSAFADAQIPPGGSYICTIGITDGVTEKTFTITGTATHGEDKAINQIYAGLTDLDITAQDSNALAATADIDITFFCEAVGQV